MGRPILSLGILTGQNGEDAILPVEYDRFGKATKSYLPFTASAGLTNKGSFLASSVSQQAGFYDNLYEGEGDYAYSTSISDYSPYDRLREVSAPGED